MKRIYKQDILSELYEILFIKGLVQLGESRFFVANGQIKMRRDDEHRSWQVSDFSLEKLKDILNGVKKQTKKINTKF